jgi:neopullulanase
MISRFTLLALAGVVCAGAQPQVTKVEPPNWWAAYTINPVRLLIRGSALDGARLSSTQGLQIANIKVSANGTYVFADVSIPADAPPGDYPLDLTTSRGSAKVPFRIAQPLPAVDNFRGFSTDDVVYLLMPDRFANGDPTNDDPAISHGLLDRNKARFYHGGDFKGIIDHLSYLKYLGVTAIWMTPVYDNNNGLNEKEKYDGQPITDFHGYGATDYYGVEEHFGTLDQLRQLVVEAHKMGLKVIQDQVTNHVGPYHPWVKNPPTPTWFHGSDSSHINETWQIWNLADPHASPFLRRQVTDGWFIDILPDMNQEDPEVHQYEIQNSLWWLGVAGFDAIRQDTWPYVQRTFWRDWMTAIKRQYPAVTAVGEVFDEDPALESYFQGGREHEGIDTGLDSVFDFPTYFKMREAFGKGKSLREVARMVGRDYLYPRPASLVTFFGNHDTSRLMSDPGATVDGLKLAFTCLLTLRGIPTIYYGDELGLRGADDPDNRRDFPGGWPGDSHTAFTESGRSPEETVVFEHVRKLTHLRAALPSLRNGELVTLVADEQVWVYARRSGAETVIVALNNDSKTAQTEVHLATLSLKDGTKLTGELGVTKSLVVNRGVATVSLPARSGEIFVVSH